MRELPEPQAGAEPDRFIDQTASDQDQTLADSDQTASDGDQTLADRDQSAGESDQRSADEDQEASDEDLAAGGDAVTHRQTRLARRRTARDRHNTSALRDDSGVTRLLSAEDRDRVAELRDRGAESRDASARLHDQQDDSNASRESIFRRGARDRARAAADRVKAAADRVQAAAERVEAARDRAAALRMRQDAEASLRGATTDELTGARTRQFGMEEVARELRRAQRTAAGLVLAFVDVDGLKQVNDSQGHPAGDQLLERTGDALLSGVRAYDLVVRYGGDEFVCAMPNMTMANARPRFEQIAANLRVTDRDHSITFGLAEAQPDDSLQTLIARADGDLLRQRSGRHHR